MKKEGAVTPQQRRNTNPILVIDDFFSSYHLHEVREELQTIKQVALTTDNDEFTTGSQRSNLLFLCEKLEGLTEAAWLLKEKEKMFKQFVQQHIVEPANLDQ